MSKGKVVTLLIPACGELPQQVQADSGYKYPSDIRVSGFFLFQRIVASVVEALAGPIERGEVSQLQAFLLIPAHRGEAYRESIQGSNFNAAFHHLQHLTATGVEISLEIIGMPPAVLSKTTIGPAPSMFHTVWLFIQGTLGLANRIKDSDAVFIHAADVLMKNYPNPSFYEAFLNTPPLDKPSLYLVPATGDQTQWTLFAVRDDDFHLLSERNSEFKMAPYGDDDPATTVLGFSGVLGARPAYLSKTSGGLRDFYANYFGPESVGVNIEYNEDSPYNIWYEGTHKAPTFYDFGHPLEFLQSRLMFSEARAHNSLRVDLDAGMVYKTSNASDFGYQCRWFDEAIIRGVPRRYLPEASTTVDMESDPLLPTFQLETELIAYPTLAEHALRITATTTEWSGMNAYEWNKCGHTVARMLKDLHSVSYANELTMDQMNRRMVDMYYTKTLNRLNQIDASALLTNEDPKTLEQRLTFVQSTLREYVDLFCLPTEDEDPAFTRVFIHGDLGFSNILYDRGSRAIKVIDPRGTFGNRTGFRLTPDKKDEGKKVLEPKAMRPFFAGDAAYDLAKLFHSTVYGYDYLMDSRLIQNVAGAKGGRSFRTPVVANGMAAFNAALSEHFPPHVIHRAHAITPLLFLSMVPLHANRPDRQAHMLYLGLGSYEAMNNAMSSVIQKDV